MPGSGKDSFFASGKFALLGVSKSKRNFARSVYDAFSRSGLKVFPVHPAGGSSRDLELYPSINSLPEPVDSAILCYDTRKSGDVLAELKAAGVKKLWFQQGSYDNSVLDLARELEIDFYTGCVLMYLPGTAFFHRLHRRLHELFSRGGN